MPVWNEYQDKNGKYVSEHKADLKKHKLVEVYAKELPDNSTFTRVGFIRGDADATEQGSADWHNHKAVVVSE